MQPEAEAQLAALNRYVPVELMKFTLTFDGELPASGNRPKPKPKWEVRNQLHPQLEELWQTHSILKAVKANAVLYKGNHRSVQGVSYDSDDFGGRPAGEGVSLNEIDVSSLFSLGGHSYRPLVRKSLHLACELDVLFLKKEEPGATILQAGDLDNRLKTLFDGLRLPEEGEWAAGEPVAEPLCCLLESDALIDAVRVRTGQLLTRPGSSVREVRAVIEVKVKVLKFRPYNAMLLGD
jgi:hypothetical protein